MTNTRKAADDLRGRLPNVILEGHEGYYPHARIKEIAALLDEAEQALQRVLRNVDNDGVGTVLIIDLQHARATLAKLRGQA